MDNAKNTSQAPLIRDACEKARMGVSHGLRIATEQESKNVFKIFSRCAASYAQFKCLVAALISSTFDHDSHTKSAISNSLSYFGKKQPELVVNAIYEFLTRHSKIDQAHRTLLMSCLNDVIDGCCDLTQDIVRKIILLASDYLTNSKKVSKVCQNAAGDVLTTLGKCYISEVVEELRNKFVAGRLPQRLVIQTLGRLAAADATGMVKHFDCIFRTTVSLLGLVKNDSLRISFSISLANFSEAISECCSNPEVVDDFDLSIFCHDINGAFDILFNSWVQTRDIEVQTAVVDALGKLILLMSNDKIEEHASKLVVLFVAMYKKCPDPLPVTSALCNVITAVTKHKSPILESILDFLLVTLHNQACIFPNWDSPDTEKNTAEVLRCLGILAASYSGIIIAMTLQRAEVRDENIRAGNLLIIKHLINANPAAMANDQDMIITGFIKQLNDQSNQVKHNMAKLVVAMGTHGYLLREGGYAYIHFIVRQCALSDQSPSSKVPQLLNSQLRDMCDDILQLLTTTVEDCEKVLWPYLFEFVVNGPLTDALGVVARSLSFLAKKKRAASSSESLIEFEHLVNIPQPVALLSRLLVMLAHPLGKRIHADCSLTLIQNLASNIHDHLPKLLDREIPMIINFLTERLTGSNDWPQVEWEDLLLKLLSDMLSAVNSEEWSCSLGQALTSQWPLYDGFPQYKSFAFKCLGVVLQKTNKKVFVESYLVLLFMSINHGNPAERRGAAVCVGKCAFHHLDATLEKLNDFIKLNITKKESSYLRILKSERSITELEQTKGTAALCCGYIAFYAPNDLIASRIETNIIKTITSLFKNIKNTQIKIDLTHSVNLIARSLDPHHTNTPSSRPRYVFTARESLMTKLLTYLKNDVPSDASQLKSVILKTCGSLVKLDPPLGDADQATMMKTILEHVIPIQAGQENKKQFLVTECTNNACTVLEEVMRKHANFQGFNFIFKHLEPYLISEQTHERLRSIQMTTDALMKFDNMVAVSEKHNALACLGLVTARLLPCTCDSVIDVRLAALTCIRQLLCFQNRTRETSGEGSVWFEEFGEKLITEDSQTMYEVVAELTKVLCLKLPSDLTQYNPGSLTCCLVDALACPQQMTSNGACLALRYIFESRGSVFASKIAEIILCLLDRLALLLGDDKSITKDGVLQLICILVYHNLHASLAILLANPLPYSEVVTMCWSRLGMDRVKEVALEFLLDQLNKNLPYDEVLKQNGKMKQAGPKIATIPSLAISCALDLLVTSSPSDAFRHPDGQTMFANSHWLIAVTLVRLGAMYDVQSPQKLTVDPYKQAIDLLKTVFLACCGRKMNIYLNHGEVWEILNIRKDDLTLTTVINSIASGLCSHHQADVPHIVSHLNNYLSSIHDMQRVVVVAFFAQLVKEQPCRDEVLLEIIMNSLRSRVIDSHKFVRLLCIVGLSNVVHASKNQVERYSATVLSAMMAGMDDNDDPSNAITLASMSGLSKFLHEVKQPSLRPIFINICLRTRPFLEKGDVRVHAAAIQLFGALAKFAADELEALYTEQSHSNLMAILLHLNDGEETVKKACKTTLKKIGPRLGSESIDKMFQKHLLDSKLHYGEFMNDLAKIMVVELLDMVSFYVMDCVSFYKSQWVGVRSNAAMFSGFLLSSLPSDGKATINREYVCTALIQLLKDSSPDVRGKAAEAIGLLHDY